MSSPLSTQWPVEDPQRCGRPFCHRVARVVGRAHRAGLLLGGTANLTRNSADFGGSLRSILEALEEQVVVLRLLAAQQEAGKVTVRIGHETEAEQMMGTSVVTTTYGTLDTVYGGMVASAPPGWTIRELSLVSLRFSLHRRSAGYTMSPHCRHNSLMAVILRLIWA